MEALVVCGGLCDKLVWLVVCGGLCDKLVWGGGLFCCC